MADIKIGISDRGVWDRQDSINVKDRPLKTGLTAKQAQDFILANPGTEVVIKQKDGKYSVYHAETSDADKAITNQDFKDRKITLTADVASIFSGKKAYISTDDNVIRSLEIEGIELKSLDQEFITANLNISVKDKDGIDTNSRNDIEGTISGKILMKKELVQYALSQANQNKYGVKCELQARPGTQEYEVDIKFTGLSLGKVTLKMEQGGIKAKIESAGAIGKTADYASYGATLGHFDLEAFATNMVKENIAKELGLKVTTVSSNEFKLVPDFTNNKLIKNIPIGDMKLNITDVKSDPSKTAFNINWSNDLEVNLYGLKVTASSDATAVEGIPDREGPDELTASINGRVNNDFSSKLDTTMGAKINITPQEQGNMSARIKKLTGKDVNVNGSVELSGVNVSTGLDATGNITYMSSIPGKININNLNLDMGAAKVSLKAASGNLEAEQKGKAVILRSNNISLNGFIDTKDVKLNVKDLRINQELVYDSSNPNRFEFNGQGNAKLNLTADAVDKKTGAKISIDNMKLQGAKAVVDMGTGEISVDSEKDSKLLVTVDKLQVPSANLKNLSFSGKLNFNTNSGVLALTGDKYSFTGKISDKVSINNLKGSGTVVNMDTKKNTLSVDASNGISADKIEVSGAKINRAVIKGQFDADLNTGKMVLSGDKISFNGKIGNIDIKSLKASGKVIYDPQEGIRVQRTSLDASGKIGDFDVTKLKGTGDIVFDKNGALVMTTVSDLTFESTKGLNVYGDLKVGYKNGVYNFITTAENPVDISYENPTNPNIVKVKHIKVDGNIAFNPATGVFTFNNDENKLKVISGALDSVTFDNFSIDGECKIVDGIVTATNSKGLLGMSGKIAGMEITDLKANKFTFNNDKSLLTLEKIEKLVLPNNKANIAITGNVTAVYDDENSFVSLTSKDGSITGNFGDIQLKDFKLDGKLTFDTAKNTLTIEGMSGSALKVAGELKGKEIDLSTTGIVKFSSDENALNIAGENIKIDGSIDGFSLKSLSGASADVKVSKTDNSVTVSNFKYDFGVGGLLVYNKDGYIEKTDLGYNVNLNGSISTSKDDIVKFLEDASQNKSLPEATRTSVKNIITTINSHLTSANLKSATYENLTLKLDKDFNFQGFGVSTKGTVTDTSLKMDIGDKKKPKIIDINLGQIDFSANASSGSDKNLKIKNGQISFNLNEKLRDTIKSELTTKLKDFGLTDIKLDVLPDGQIKLKNATYEIFSTPLDKLGRAVTNAGIPIISSVLGRLLRLTDISVDLKLATKIENNKLVLSVDETTVNELLLFLATKTTDALGVTDMKDVAAKTIAKKLPESIPKDIKGNVISVDLQKVVTKLSPDVKLTGIDISKEGQVNVGFEYNKAAKK